MLIYVGTLQFTSFAVKALLFLQLPAGSKAIDNKALEITK